MPSTTITVTEVSGFAGTSFWTIKGTDDSGWLWTFTTNSPWKASLAKSVILSSRAIEVQWRDTRKYGRDVVFLDYAEKRASA